MKFTSCLSALLVTLSLAGCCCGRNVVMDPCDPCSSYAPMSRHHGGMRWLWPGSWFHGCGGGCGCSCGCHSGYGMYGEIFDEGCGGMAYDCGGGGSSCAGCGSPGVIMNGMPSSGGCACGQTAPTMMNAPMNSTPMYSAPTQAPTSPEPPPVPPATDTTSMVPPSPSNQMQTVSYEEFQRLPGTIVSGPGSAAPAVATNAAAAPASTIQRTSAVNLPYLPPPSPTAPTASRPVPSSQTRQASWQSAKPY